MVCLGNWTAGDFERHSGEGKGRALVDVVMPDAVDWLWRRSDAGIYVFRCPNCGRLGSHWDND